MVKNGRREAARNCEMRFSELVGAVENPQLPAMDKLIRKWTTRERPYIRQLRTRIYGSGVFAGLCNNQFGFMPEFRRRMP